jgi:N-acyl-D-amino-acid deacylase
MQRRQVFARTYSCVFGVSLLGLGVASSPNPGLVQEPETNRFDILLTGGRVIDGTGNPWFRADVGVRGDRIVAIGDLTNADATRRIDIEGRFIVPGFIDIHSHADEGLDAENTGASGERRRAAPNLVSQGITTVVINQDGRSEWPIAEQRAKLERLRIGPNAGLMVGHNAIRGITLGDDYRRSATVDEIDRMRAMVRQAMGEGAYGLSAGLEYVPGRWSTTEEVVALVAEAGAGGGVYIVHERSSGLDPMWFWPSHDPPGPPTMFHTILEDIEVAERTGVTTVATHIKARGANFWGSGRALIHLIERARGRGVPIWADQYPYNTTGSDGSTVLIPGWFTSEIARDERRDGPSIDFASALRRALLDPEMAVDIRRDIAHEIQRRGGPPNLIVFEFPDSSFIGKNLEELAADAGLDPVEMAIQLQLEGYADRRGGARIRGFSLSEIDVEAFAAQPWMVTATDAGIALPGDGPVHARYYGTFPRKIRRYALERGALSVEDAIRSATSLPALILGMKDRGLVREGFHADLAVLNLETIRDRATFFQPHQMAEGVDYVLINGTFAVDAGELTYALPGRILTPDEGRRAPVVPQGGAR